MDIISLPIEFDKEKIDGRFRLVNIIAQRAKELAQSAQPKMSTKAKKVTSIALYEAVNYKLDFITGEEAKQAKEEAKKLDYKKFLEEKKRESEHEDLTELERDLKFYLDEKVEPGIPSIEKLFSGVASSKDDEGAGDLVDEIERVDDYTGDETPAGEYDGGDEMDGSYGDGDDIASDDYE